MGPLCVGEGAYSQPFCLERLGQGPWGWAEGGGWMWGHFGLMEMDPRRMGEEDGGCSHLHHGGGGEGAQAWAPLRWWAWGLPLHNGERGARRGPAALCSTQAACGGGKGAGVCLSLSVWGPQAQMLQPALQLPLAPHRRGGSLAMSGCSPQLEPEGCWLRGAGMERGLPGLRRGLDALLCRRGKGGGGLRCS